MMFIEVINMDKKKKRNTISPPKYKVPEDVKEQARVFLKDFLKEQNIKPPALATMCKEAYGRSDSRISMINKFKRSSFKLTEVMQIVDLFGYELKIVPKTLIEQNNKTNS